MYGTPTNDDGGRMAAISGARKWLWIGLAALAVVALVVAAVLTAGEGDGPTAPGTTETTSTAGSQSVATSHAPAPGSPAAAAASAAAVTSSGAGATRPAAPPTKPVDEGAELATVTTPPSRTLAMVERDTATANSTYDVVFQVYGFGPGGGSMASLVVSISSSKPSPGTEKPMDLNKRNALCRMSASEAEAVTLGGTYKGVITLKPSGDVLVLWLSDVTVQK